MTKIPRLAILISAAGTSRRMGSPKQLLKWGNSTLLGHTIETAINVGLESVVVVLGSDFEKISQQITNLDCTILNHMNWGNGLGSSISFGIKYLQQHSANLDGVLVMLADQPLIDVTYLKAMISHFEVNKEQIIATDYSKQKMGVPVLFDKFYLAELSELKDDQGAKQILNQYADKVFLVTSEGKTADIDTSEDYEKLYKANHQL